MVDGANEGQTWPVAQTTMQYYLNLGLASTKVRLGTAVIHDARTWPDETWKGRRASTRLVRE
ncbi:MAG: hypothetical protein O3C45_00845 [Bacteroidetes bacterium]|nr:hypothetical protein [Bacteroidota bacterium]MDA0873586.1 hypothetical protein [Bacteroidota bacterium]